MYQIKDELLENALFFSQVCIVNKNNKGRRRRNRWRRSSRRGGEDIVQNVSDIGKLEDSVRNVSDIGKLEEEGKLT